MQKHIAEAHCAVFSVLSISFPSFLLALAVLIFMFLNSWLLLSLTSVKNTVYRKKYLTMNTFKVKK